MDSAIDSDVFIDILKFIYTGDSNSIINPDNAVDLLQTSDRLMMESLRDVVEDYIENSVDLENCGHLIDIADRFSAPKLRRVCLELVTQSSENLHKFQKTSGFLDLKDNPNLVKEIELRAVRNQICSPGEILQLLMLEA